MARAALSTRRVEGIGEGSLVGTLSRLLQLTSEAVLVFDGMGRVLLANDEAAQLFACGDALVGTDVRLVFPAADGSAPKEAFDLGDLPFEVDGSLSLIACMGAAGRLVPVRVRCDTVQAPGETYLLVALAANSDERQAREHDRVLDDLRRANHRLSGALNIVLDTLDSADVGTLFGRVLEEITETMEADGTIVYLAESDGFHLRGISSGLAGEKIVRFMAFDRAVERLAIREGHAVRLRVCAPSGEALRQGRLTTREVVNEETHEILRLRRELLPPFTSFVAVPVWFGGHVISIIEVGWRRMHPLAKEDAQLLDSVAHYLSVQLAGAFSSLRAERAERLSELGTALREELMTFSADDQQALERVLGIFGDAAEELDAVPVKVEVNEHQRVVLADLPKAGQVELPLDLEEFERGEVHDGVALIPVLPDSELSAYLHSLGEPCVGVFMDAGELGGVRRCGLALRASDAEPFDDLELEFLSRLADDVRTVALGEEERAQDKRISQALQTGMRNELQKVDGITAQAVYSSATAAAFVGGDFYDLVRLPGQRACVIMGDVSGKGVEAASVSAAVKTALAAYAWEGLAPARMVRLLNDFLLGFARLETFATLFVGIVDVAKGTLTYCSAGHPPALLLGPSADEVSMLDVQSGVVGAFHDMLYQDGVANLQKGDVLLLYTDGTTEARAPSGAFFGEQGLRDMVMRESAGDKPFDGFVDRLLATIDAFTGQNLEDDVAMLAMRYDGLSEAPAPEAPAQASRASQASAAR